MLATKQQSILREGLFLRLIRNKKFFEQKMGLSIFCFAFLICFFEAMSKKGIES